MAKTTGERIRNRRIELHLTQSQLAERTGYKDKTGVSRVENGETDLTQSKIVVFAKALDTTVPYLMGWVTEPTAKPAKTNTHTEAHNEINEIINAYDNADERTRKAVKVILGLE